VGAETLHADGRTDGHDEANSRFSQLSNAPKKKRKKDSEPVAAISKSCENTRTSLFTSVSQRCLFLSYFISTLKPIFEMKLNSIYGDKHSLRPLVP
jgi:hypothetical protein